MYKLLIADDDAVIRTSLETLFDWKSMGITLVHSAENGKVALATIRTQRVDILLTDIKMPHMDGLALMEELNKLPSVPLVYVLSSYEDFPLVRKAFNLGAVDYIPKSELEPRRMVSLMENATRRLVQNGIFPEAAPPINDRLYDALQALVKGTGESDIDLLVPCVLALLSVDSPSEARARFGNGNLDDNLQAPMLSFVDRIPQLNRNGTLYPIDNFHYLFYYTGGKQTRSKTLVSIIRRLQDSWSNFLNLSVSAVVGDIASTEEEIRRSLSELRSKEPVLLLYGKQAIVGKDVPAPQLVPLGNLDRAIKTGDDTLLESELTKRIRTLQEVSPIEAKRHVEDLTYSLLYGFGKLGIDIDELTGSLEPDIHTKIDACETCWDLGIWLQNFAKRLKRACQQDTVRRNLDPIDKACNLIRENYADPSLSLSLVAEEFGLNEKYFATLFKKKMGVTFLTYLTDIRIDAAKAMLADTNMKVYEICHHVGYNSVEHFSRVFKKHEGHSPKHC